MKFKLFLITLIIFFSFGFSTASADQYGCPSFEGFVWSRVSGRCVQAICPNDSIGRDTSGDCTCPSGREPQYKDRKLVACIEPALEIEENTINTSSIPDSSVVQTITSTGVQQIATNTNTKKETRDSSAMPNTITIIVIVALGIGFWLYKLPPLKK